MALKSIGIAKLVKQLNRKCRRIIRQKS